jgi:hypothetical protein
MPFLNLAGKPAIRFPDPKIASISPNGTQPYSVYEAPLVYFGTAGDPSTISYTMEQVTSEGVLLQFLFFGMDYPASVLVNTTFLDNGYTYNPDTGLSAPNLYSGMTFTEGIVGVNQASYFTLPNVLQGSITTNYKYQEIITDKTVTNGVVVSGFPFVVSTAGHGIYVSAGTPPNPPDPEQANLTWYATTVMNGATISSASAHFGFDLRPDPLPPEQIINIPIILWEADLTQQMVDDEYHFNVQIDPDQDLRFEIVALWGADNFTPRPPAMRGARSAAPAEPPKGSLVEQVKALKARVAAAKASR